MPVACVFGAHNGQGVVTAKLKVWMRSPFKAVIRLRKFLDGLEETLLFEKVTLYIG